MENNLPSTRAVKQPSTQFSYMTPVPSVPDGDLQVDAQLIVNFLVKFSSGQHPLFGCWIENGPTAQLRLTCHILEALWLFDLEAMWVTLDNGISWLVNLSDRPANGDSPEDAAYEHPSRFKTLIWLQQFTYPEIREEFQKLGANLDAEGLLQKAPIEPILASMIYLDSLLLLEESDTIDSKQVIHRDCILSMLNVKVFEWCNSNATDLKEGELSYAFDLLVRSGQYDAKSEIAKFLRDHLGKYIDQHKTDRPLESDVLYCAIHLVSHFPDDEFVNTVIGRLTTAIHQKYANQDFRRESSSFDPLYMRLLIQLRGTRLKSEVMNLLLQREYRHLIEVQRHESAHRQATFVQVIKNRIRVTVEEYIPLTGGLTHAEVFRVKFNLHLRGVSEDSSTSYTHINGDFNSMVVKIDTLSDLWTAIDRYEKLPLSIKPYFANHSGPPSLLESSNEGQAALVLEDLTDKYETFRSIVDRYDRLMLSWEQNHKLFTACGTVLRQLFQIYEYSRRPASLYSGYQLYRLYLGAMERSLIEAAEKHPHFKAWYQGFWLNNKIRFPGIDYYHSKLERFKDQLRVNQLMLVHGDCHTRNIMIDDCFEYIKLIDLDKISDKGDYIQDIAMMIEDIAIFRFVFDQDYKYCMDPEYITFPAHDTGGIEDGINYAAPTSHMVINIQEYILAQVERYAQSIGDTEWRARLWLALTVHLLRLVEKQADIRLASVLYVEAIKLLDTLEYSLENKQMPPGIPFPGERKVVEGAMDNQELWPQVIPKLRHNLIALHTAMQNEIDGLRIDRRRSGSMVRYYLAAREIPILIINGERSPVQVRLSVDPDLFQGDKQFISRYRTNGPFRTQIELVALENTHNALDILRRAIGHLSSTRKEVEIKRS